ncbi:alpha/beta hydrolase [Antrihabitans stalagmiti]|nr:alpha/beta hydrolase [Antrihabitans stalagmiti]
MSRAFFRPLVGGYFVLVERGPLRGDRAFRLANFVDLLLAPLRPPRGTQRRAVQFEKFRAEWLWHREDPSPDAVGHGAILYLHGGAFVTGGLNSHRRLAARIARAAGVALLNVDYRQLPHAHFLDSVDDVVTAYEHLLELGFAPRRIVFAGDSAGGGLTFAAALAARDRGLPTPAAIAAISPLADLDSTLRAAHPNDRRDAMLSARGLGALARVGFARGDELDPQWSPVSAEFTCMPPALIQVSDSEVLLVDAELLADRYREANVPLTLQIWDNAIHVFQFGADLLPDARSAIAEIGHFVRSAFDDDIQDLQSVDGERS